MFGIEHVQRLASKVQDVIAAGRFVFQAGGEATRILDDLAEDDPFWVEWDQVRERADVVDDDLTREEFLQMETGLLIRYGMEARYAATLAAMVMRAARTPVDPSELPSAEEMRASVRELSRRLGQLPPNSIEAMVLLADAGLVIGGVAVASVDAAEFVGSSGLNLPAARSVLPALKAMALGTRRLRH